MNRFGNKALFLGSALIVSSHGFLVGCSRHEAQGAATNETRISERAPVAIQVEEVQGSDRPITLTLDGTLVADEESQVTSVVPGRVMRVLVERGSTVRQGEPLVRLRDVDFRLQARAAHAQLEQAQARLGMSEGADAPRAAETPSVRAARSDLELAESSLARAEELARRDVFSAQQLEEARGRAAAARERLQMAMNDSQVALAQLDSARVALRQASTSASDATVRAPFTGEVAERNVSVGEYVSPQTSLVTLVRMDPLRIELEVPQQHLQAVREGQTVALTVDALPNQTFEATVRYVSAAVRRDTRALTVEAVVANPDRTLRPGLYATARLATGGTSQVALISPSAVLSQAGVDRAFVVNGDHVEERILTVVDRTEQRVVVSDGLRAGERVATSGLEQLADGSPIQVNGPRSADSDSESTEVAPSTEEPAEQAEHAEQEATESISG